jgi:hypothetical protein
LWTPRDGYIVPYVCNLILLGDLKGGGVGSTDTMGATRRMCSVLSRSKASEDRGGSLCSVHKLAVCINSPRDTHATYSIFCNDINVLDVVGGLIIHAKSRQYSIRCHTFAVILELSNKPTTFLNFNRLKAMRACGAFPVDAKIEEGRWFIDSRYPFRTASLPLLASCDNTLRLRPFNNTAIFGGLLRLPRAQRDPHRRRDHS